MDKPIKDTVALLNTTDLSPVIESTELMRVSEIVKVSSGINGSPNGSDKESEVIEVAMTVAKLSSTSPIQVRY